MPLFLTRRDREILAEQERIEEAERLAEQDRQRQIERQREENAQKSARQIEWEERMRRKEEIFRAEVNPPLRDYPMNARPFRSNLNSVCGAFNGFCSCGHNCKREASKCDHLYKFGEITCLKCGQKLGA